MSPWDAMVEQLRRAVREVLVEAGLERPAPYPVAVSVAEAARLLSTSSHTIMQLVRTGQLRTLQLDGVRRTLIPTVALFELDPAHRPADMAQLDTGDHVEDFGPEWDR